MSEEQTTDIGHNNPPPTAEAAIRLQLDERHEDIAQRTEELVGALDRVPDLIEDEETAQRVSDFVKQINAAKKKAEAQRVSEKEPYLTGGKAVDGWFKGMTLPLDKAAQLLKEKLTAYHVKKETEERRRREEEERARREEEERLRREAEEKAAAAATDDDLNEAIEAEQAAAQRAAEAHDAGKKAQAPAAELSRTRGEYGAVSSLATFMDFKDVDYGTIDLEALRPHLKRDDIDKAIRAYIKAGNDEIRGATIFQNKRTRVS